MTPVIINGIPSYNKGEVKIRFNKNVLILSTIDNTKFAAGKLSDFVKKEALTEMSNRLKFDVSDLPTFKVFRRMTSADTISISRLGDKVKIPPFWATLSIMLPDTISERQVMGVLNTLRHIINYAELNRIGGKLNSTPNDALYQTKQRGLTNPSYGINIEGAWDKQVGQDFVKVGVFDTGINWEHEDFHVIDGDTTWDGSKIKGGKDYYHDVDISLQIKPDHAGHGTACAGIIGALRNNNKGIAGIAGGDVENDNTGIQLYDSKIFYNITFYDTIIYIDTIFNDTVVYVDTLNNEYFVGFDVASEAIVEGSTKNSNTSFGYGMNIQSHSWGGQTYSKTLREAIRISNTNKCIISVASGNDYAQTFGYPASYNDSWVLKVGASDTFRERALFSNYGYYLDFLAPGVENIYGGLNHDANNGYSYNADGTSFACPHVTGVAALMYSQHHPLNNILYPNTLAPEDVEIMLKKCADSVIVDSFEPNITLPIPNIYAGYGIINAGETLNKISLPYRIRHYEDSVSVSQAVLLLQNHNVVFPEYLENINPSYTLGTTDIYKFDVTLFHTLPNNENYLDAWIRNSSCDLYELTSTLYTPHWSGVTMNSSNADSATFTGYIYKTKILDSTGQLIEYRWFPFDLNSIAKFSYSIYTIDDDPSVGIVDVENEFNLALFPNPTKNELNIKFNSKDKDVSNKIYDISGRLVSENYYLSNKLNEQIESIDISAYTEGLYLLKFTAGETQVTRKFLKK